jgi:hypothetical protein
MKANIEDSTFSGITFANTTCSGSVEYAYERVSVIVEVRKTNASGDKPKVICLVYRMVVEEPNALTKRALIISVLTSRVFKHMLYINIEINRAPQPTITR